MDLVFWAAATFVLTVLVCALLEATKPSSRIAEFVAFVVVLIPLVWTVTDVADKHFSSDLAVYAFGAALIVATIVCVYVGTRLGLFIRKRKERRGRGQ